MKHTLITFFWLTLFCIANAQELKSPNGALRLTFVLQADGTPTYQLTYKNKEVIKQSKLGLQLKNDKRDFTPGGNLKGQSFIFTGTLSKLKRSEAEEIVEQNGGTILSGISSKLNYLVVGEDAGSKLEKAKKINSIKIISEDQFLKMTNKE